MLIRVGLEERNKRGAFIKSDAPHNIDEGDEDAGICILECELVVVALEGLNCIFCQC